MVPILGKPVLEYLIEHLARYGVNETMINVAFNHHKIEEYCVDRSGETLYVGDDRTALRWGDARG
nr:hypothetical protein [Aromatoleum diolicum]